MLGNWALATTTTIRSETVRKVCSAMSRQRERDRETWWCNEEVQESIKRRLAKKEAG